MSTERPGQADDHAEDWLTDAEWAWVQTRMPIACVDVLPYRIDNAGSLEAVGLILRDDPLPGRDKGWCLIGGRLKRDEPLTNAIGRQLRETLGDAVRFTIPADPQPVHVGQYFTFDRGPDMPWDPRQHAISLVFSVELAGSPEAQGEAHDFCWFGPTILPAPHQFGFRKSPIVAHSLARLVSVLSSADESSRIRQPHLPEK